LGSLSVIQQAGRHDIADIGPSKTKIRFRQCFVMALQPGSQIQLINHTSNSIHRLVSSSISRFCAGSDLIWPEE
jgi:hypothetical protein